jgi:hypothetical protein
MSENRLMSRVALYYSGEISRGMVLGTSSTVLSGHVPKICLSRKLEGAILLCSAYYIVQDNTFEDRVFMNQLIHRVFRLFMVCPTFRIPSTTYSQNDSLGNFLAIYRRSARP